MITGLSDLIKHIDLIDHVRHVLQLISYFSQLLRCTAIQRGSVRNPNNGTLSLIFFMTPMLLNANHPTRTIPTSYAFTSRISTLPIEVHQLTDLKNFTLSDMSPSGSEESSSGISSQKQFFRFLNSVQILFKGQIFIAKTLNWQMISVQQP